MRVSLRSVLPLAILLPCLLPAQNPQRRALLIGNGAYVHFPPMPGVNAELHVMEEALRQAGFAVTVARDVTLPQFPETTLPAFLAGLQPGDTCLVYYSGYAVQVEGDNLLLPVDFDPALKQPISGRAYSFGLLQFNLEQRNVGLKILILEASRDPQVPIVGATGSGLAVPDLAEFNEVVYASAAQPNQVLGPPPGGGIGLFTKAVAENIRKPGSDVIRVFSEVIREVAQTSNQQQAPFLNPKISKQFFFVAPEAPKPPPSKPEGPIPGFPRQNRKDREEYVWIPPGKFLMGCVPGDSRCEEHEKPQHAVTISKGFWLGRNEVQVGSYQRYVEDDKKNRSMPKPGPLWDSKWRLTNYPINSVSWDDAAAYCQWAGGRLPTEAEWEYAARGNLPNQIYPLNDENSRDKANFAGKKGNDRWDAAAPVRSFDPSPTFSLFDMAGNVWEWVQDWYSKDYFQNSPAVDPPGPLSGKGHVIRGGSWYSDPKQHLRISFRKIGEKGNLVGFRCALDDTAQVRALLGVN